MEPSTPAPSPTAQNPPPRKPGGPGKFKKTVMALARTVHIYATLFAFLGLLLFSVSGFILHHPNWFAVSYKSQIIAHLPPELVTAPDDQLERLKIVERLRADAHVSGNVRMAEPAPGQPADTSEGLAVDENTITLTMEGPSRSFNITIYRTPADNHKADNHKPEDDKNIDLNHKPGDTHIELETRGLTGFLGDLHMGQVTGSHWWAWSLVIDVVSITLCLASLTGLLIWTQLTKRRTIGLLCLGAGTALIVAVYLAFVP